MTKLKIIIIGLVITTVILGNFWYYIHSLNVKEIAENIPRGTTVSQKKSNTTTKSTSKTSTATTESFTASTVKTSTTATESSTASTVSSQSTGTSISNSSANTPDVAMGNTTQVRKKNIVTTNPVGVEKNITTTESITTDSEDAKTNDVANYAALEKILVDKSWNGGRSNYAHYWGNENVSFEGDTLKILYPKGSNAPSNTPRGGAGFVYNFPKSYDHISLSYTIKFENGFDFVKGGKLPGLCGGNCSRSESMSTASGFSMRFVWKKNGYLDIMTFFPNTVKAGNYSGEKMFKFVPGKEYLITQQLTLNDPGKANGIITILVDGKDVYTKNDVVIRVSPDVQITSFLFSTFFGGKDDTYSSSKDAYIHFGKFKISDTF